MTDKDQTAAETDDIGVHALEPEKEVPPSMKKIVAKAAVKGSVEFGKSAVAYLKKLCGIRDPKAALEEIKVQLGAVRERLNPLWKRYEALYSQISTKKKLRESAPPARRRMLDMALRSLLAEYTSIERQIGALGRKEEMLVTIHGRMEELDIQGLPMPRVEDVDRLADDIVDAIDNDEDMADAVADLNKIEPGRERHPVNLDEALDEFEVEPPDVKRTAEAQANIEQT